MNYIRLWQQAENGLILNDSIKLMNRIKQYSDINFVRAKIKSWDELVSLYGMNGDGSIDINEDDICFIQSMKKLCGEEFEIAMKREPTDRPLFYIRDKDNRWTITRHMINIIESKDFEINKNWPIVQIAVNSIIMDMWERLYHTCKKSERKILDKIIDVEQELTQKRVRVKSLEELKIGNTVFSNGDIVITNDGSIFLHGMQSLCGREFIATYQDNTYVLGRLLNRTGSWDITRSMVTEI